jgi:hypothetical protein
MADNSTKRRQRKSKKQRQRPLGKMTVPLRAAEQFLGNAQALERRSSANAQYLQSFVRPEKPARGPYASSYPTHLLTFTSTWDFTVKPYDTSYVFYDSALPAAQQVAWDANGQVAIVVCPNIQYDSASFSTTSQVNPGWFYSPSTQFKTTISNNSTASTLVGDYCPIGAIPPFSQAVPGLIVGDGSLDIKEYYYKQMPFRYRHVGLRSTLATTSNFMNSEGSILVGDAGDFVIDDNPSDQVTVNDSGVASILNSTQSGLANLSLASTNWPRIRSCGSITGKTVAEAIAVPMNGQWSRYSRQIYAQDTTAHVPPSGLYRSHVNGFINSPANIFILTGSGTDTQSFTLGVTWSIEVIVEPEGPLAALSVAAEYNPVFDPEWDLLGQIRPGGCFGEPRATAMRACPCIARAAVQRMPKVTRTSAVLASGALDNDDTVPVREAMAEAERTLTDELSEFLEPAKRVAKSLGGSLANGAARFAAQAATAYATNRIRRNYPGPGTFADYASSSRPAIL